MSQDRSRLKISVKPKTSAWLGPFWSHPSFSETLGMVCSSVLFATASWSWFFNGSALRFRLISKYPLPKSPRKTIPTKVGVSCHSSVRPDGGAAVRRWSPVYNRSPLLGFRSLLIADDLP